MDRGSRYKIEVVVAPVDTLGFVAIAPCGIAEASTDSGSPMDAIHLCLRSSGGIPRNGPCSACSPGKTTLFSVAKVRKRAAPALARIARGFPGKALNATAV